MNSTVDAQLQSIANSVMNSASLNASITPSVNPSVLVEPANNTAWASNPLILVLFAVVSFVLAASLIYVFFGNHQEF